MSWTLAWTSRALAGAGLGGPGSVPFGETAASLWSRAAITMAKAPAAASAAMWAAAAAVVQKHEQNSGGHDGDGEGGSTLLAMVSSLSSKLSMQEIRCSSIVLGCSGPRPRRTAKKNTKKRKIVVIFVIVIVVIFVTVIVVSFSSRHRRRRRRRRCRLRLLRRPSLCCFCFALLVSFSRQFLCHFFFRRRTVSRIFSSSRHSILCSSFLSCVRPVFLYVAYLGRLC